MAVFLASAAPPGVTGRANAQEFNNQYGLTNIGSDAAFNLGIFGTGSRIAVFDTALDVNHPEFQGRIGPSFDIYTGLGNGGFDLDHGTHVAGIAAAAANGTGMMGVAPEATILPVTLLLTAPGAPAGTISFANLDALVPSAFDFAIAQSADVINNSWGVKLSVTTPGLKPVLDADLGNFLDAARRTADAGIVTAWATGNDSIPDPSLFSALPHLYPELQPIWLAVTALDPDNSLASYANQCGAAANWCLAAPGTQIASTIPVPRGSYNRFDGTSMATPHVSGAVAIARSIFPNAAGSDLADLVLKTATDLGAPGVDPVFGWGALSVRNIVATADPATASLYAEALWSRFSTLDLVNAALPTSRSVRAENTGGTLNALGYAADTGRTAAAPFQALGPRPYPAPIWLSGLYGHGKLDAGSSSPGASQDASGFLAGLDLHRSEQATFGLGAGVTWSDMQSNGLANTLQSRAAHLFAYGDWQQGPWFIEGVGQIAYFDDRFVRGAISGAGTTATSTGRASASALAGAVRLAAGRSVMLNDLDLEPYVAGAVRWQNAGRFSEAGASVFALDLPAISAAQMETGFGLRSDFRPFALGSSSTAQLSLDLSYAHLSGDRDLQVQANLLGNTLQAGTAVLGAHIVRVGADLSVGTDRAPSLLVLSYDGQFQDNATAHAVGARLRFRF